MRWIEHCLVDGWMDSCNLSPGAERAARYDLLMYERHIASRNTVLEATVREDVTSFLAWLENEHAPSVAYHALNTVRRFYEWAEGNGFHRDVAKGVAMGDIGKAGGTRAPIRAEHVGKLLSACADDRERALVALMALAALRPREVERACVGDVRLEGPMPRIVLGRDAAYLTPPCVQILSDHIGGGNAAGEDPLFASRCLRTWGARLSMRSIREIVHDAFDRSGVPGRLGTCDLAGAAVELAVESGAEPAVIAAIATRCAEQGRFGRASKRSTYRPSDGA